MALVVLVVAAATATARGGRSDRHRLDAAEEDREGLIPLPRLLGPAREGSEPVADGRLGSGAAEQPTVPPAQREIVAPPAAGLPLRALLAIAAVIGGGVAVQRLLGRRRRAGRADVSWTDPEERAAELRDASRTAAIAEAGGTLAESGEEADLLVLAPGARHAAGGRGCSWSKAFLAAWYRQAFAEPSKVVEVSHGDRACVFEVR
ncbi:MAG TPA: hypothetical protein VI997_09920 [Candidatus Thermoplasmatota archaeon]|nr:hypothetical protein [Candidatus Thermoplasmatota archaeon]